MINLENHKRISSAVLLAVGMLLLQGSFSAYAQTSSPDTSDTLTLAMGPIQAGSKIGAAVPGVHDVEVTFPPVGEDAYSQAVEGLFASGPSVPEEIENAYRMNGMAPLWVGETGAAPGLEAISEVFAKAGEHGLVPARYQVPAGISTTPPASPQEAARDDLALSRAIFAYLSDIRLGVLRPGIRGRYTVLVSKNIDMQRLFAQVLSNPAQGLAAASPPTASYQNLVRLLAVARADQVNGEWGTISRKGRSLRPGKTDKRVPQIAARLAADGKYTPPATEEPGSLVYTPALVDVVKAFQARHGLGVDGIAGWQTIAALNVTAQGRVEQVIANLERERWQPETTPDRLVEVNVPAYRLVAWDGGVAVLEMDVIVGRSKRPTPIFADTIRYVEFNPTWTVPKKLAVEDIGPQAIKDPDYLASKGFTIYSNWQKGAAVVDPTTIDWSQYNKYNIPFRLVQAPGKKNSLGSVKFMFPNKFAVYLHDTPGKNLFRKAIRAISSGCIRVKNPRAFTSYLLSSQMEESQIDRALSREKTRQVRLKSPVAVRLVYRSAWLSETGEPQYRADVYGRDKRIIRDLRAKGAGL